MEINCKNENDLISVIVPVYKVEKYLSECIESILKQTYKNLEVILVDDGSPDDCGKICDDYADKDNRITVIHKENGGLSDARNSGIEIAKGKWIVFVDSDDFINTNMIQKLYTAAVDNDAKMAWCKIREVDEKGFYFKDELKIKQDICEETNCENIEMFDHVEAEKLMYTINYNQECLVAWNKIYHIDLFGNDGNKVRYPFGKVFEDGYTTYKLIYNSDKVAVISEQLYYYRQRGGSIMDSDANINYVPALDGGTERLAFYNEHNEKELYKLELNLSIYSVIRFYSRVKTHQDKKELKRWFKIFYNDYFVKEKWPLAKRIRIGSFRLGYPVYAMISSFEKIYNKIKGK